MELWAHNVNDALRYGLEYLYTCGVEETSRNGTVMVAPVPVMTTYTRPRERVLFSPMRDANPFFHFMESLWMLAGRNDVRWIGLFNKTFSRYSDDGEVFYGAYGYRWRHWFGYDQLKTVAEELARNHDTRRAVLTMWDPSADPQAASAGGKDVPCNTHVYFDSRGGRLNMTVCCRSNDIYWGAYGANAVHFSVLQEVMASWIGVEVGQYRQFSNNFHIYTDVVPKDKFLEVASDAKHNNLYELTDKFVPYNIVNTSIGTWFKDLDNFIHEGPDGKYEDPFFSNVAAPMYAAYEERTECRGHGLELLNRVEALDWKMAGAAWINRREKAKRAKKADAANA